MDYNELETTFGVVRQRGTLPIDIRIHDGDRYAAVDVDIQILETVLFCCAVTEEAWRHIDSLLGGLPYPNSERLGRVVDEMATLRLMGVEIESELLARGQEFARLFGDIIARRDTRLGIAASDILRLEFVGILRENPTVLKLIASGVAGALLLATTAFSAVVVIRAGQETACVAEVREVQRVGREQILQQARLEGRATEVHEQMLRQIDATMDTAIAACSAKLDFTFRAKGPGFEVEAGVKAIRDRPYRK